MRLFPALRTFWLFAGLLTAASALADDAGATSLFNDVGGVLKGEATAELPLVGGLEAPLLLAQGSDCSRAAAQAAAQTGGEVLSVSTRSENGRTVCEVTVLIPGRDGERPRRTTITIPG